MTRALVVETIGQNDFACACCGGDSRKVWGNVISETGMVACYFVHWARGQPSHYPNLDFLIGTWGDDSTNDRVLVSWLYSAERNQFMLADGSTRPAASSGLCSRAMSRIDVLAEIDLLQIAKAVLDAVWVGDPRIDEIKTVSS